MSAISASLVKELREMTGAGMMDCKKALGETEGNLEAAVDWLRKKGLAAAAKKAGRTASEGLVGVATSGTAGAAIELNSETDFVARNEKFQVLVSNLAKLALENTGDVEALASVAYPGSDRTVADELTQQIATIGENMQLRRAARVTVSQGVVASYVHNAIADGMGKIGVLIGLESAADADKLSALGRQIAMHVAAARPESITKEELNPELIERERTVLSDQARASGKPENIIEKMVEGRLRKFYEEVVLLEQVFVVDGERTVGKVLEDAGKEFGAPIKLTAMVRLELGEGVEKEEEDFASEVAATLKK
jgi:elongation factor Ts